MCEVSDQDAQEVITKENLGYAHVILAGVHAMNRLHAWEWIKHLEPTSGFIWMDHPIVDQIRDDEEVMACGHSGSSFGYTMRCLQTIAKTVLVSTVDNCCAICLDEITTDIVKLECEHTFHRHCLVGITDKEFQVGRACPLCRKLTVPRHL